MYKIWSRDRTRKKSIVANNMIELINKGKRKMEIADPVTVVMEEDGTEVDDDEVLQELKGTRLIFLTEGQKWVAAGSESTIAKETPSATPTIAADVNVAPKYIPTTPSPVLISNANNLVDIVEPIEINNDSAVHHQQQSPTESNSDDPKALTRLPQFSPTVLYHLENGTPEHVWEKMIAEAGEFYMHSSTPDLHLTYHYQLVGKTMYKRYPSIGQSGPHPWTRFTSNLSRRMRHIRWKKKKKAGMPSKSRHQFLTSSIINPPISNNVNYQVEPLMTYSNQTEDDIRKQITKFEAQEDEEEDEDDGVTQMFEVTECKPIDDEQN